MQQDRLAIIDGIRGIAALTIVLFHYSVFFVLYEQGPSIPEWRELLPGRELLWPVKAYGLYAVQLFWVISGFIFTHVYLANDRVTTSDFFIARFARLYPLHLLTLLCMTGLIYWGTVQPQVFMLPENADPYHFVLNLLFAPAWGFQHGKSFNSVIWSVSVEVPIYALFWIMRGKLARHGSLCAVLLALACGFIVLTRPPTFIFACGYYFFSGSAVAISLREIGASVKIKVLLGAALACMSALGFLLGGDVAPNALGLNGAFCLLVLLAVEGEKYAAARLRTAAEWLGDTSYGIYLWHIPISLLLKFIICPVTDISALALNGWFMAGYVALVLVVARLSFIWFEMPARKLIRARLSRRGAASPSESAEGSGEVHLAR